MELYIILEPQEEGGYTVYVPSLQGCVSQGETKEEAIENIKEAIQLYLEPDQNEIMVYLDKGISEKIIV
ncbi:MAG: type II toxin-antitoxin system HicB family antitoxin [Nanoarchaeota archaeon]